MREQQMGDDLREVLLTLSPVQFDRFAEDLKLLREHGAESNTHAVLEAVRERAAGVKVASVDQRSAA